MSKKFNKVALKPISVSRSTEIYANLKTATIEETLQAADGFKTGSIMLQKLSDECVDHAKRNFNIEQIEMDFGKDVIFTGASASYEPEYVDKTEFRVKSEDAKKIISLVKEKKIDDRFVVTTYKINMPNIIKAYNDGSLPSDLYPYVIKDVQIGFNIETNKIK